MEELKDAKTLFIEEIKIKEEQKEILRKQLSLLAEKSKKCKPTELTELSKAMCEVITQYKSLTASW